MQYFSNKNYRMLYYDSFFKTFANSIYAVFTPVILYKAGVSITMIIFIFMIQFLVMGLFSPLAGTLSKRIGIANTKFISYILKSISMLLVLTVDTNIKYYLVIAVVYGLSGAANNPIPNPNNFFLCFTLSTLLICSVLLKMQCLYVILYPSAVSIFPILKMI